MLLLASSNQSLELNSTLLIIFELLQIFEEVLERSPKTSKRFVQHFRRGKDHPTQPYPGPHSELRRTNLTIPEIDNSHFSHIEATTSRTTMTQLSNQIMVSTLITLLVVSVLVATHFNSSRQQTDPFLRGKFRG
jgi:hypothetical protein